MPVSFVKEYSGGSLRSLSNETGTCNVYLFVYCQGLISGCRCSITKYVYRYIQFRTRLQPGAMATVRDIMLRSG